MIFNLDSAADAHTIFILTNFLCKYDVWEVHQRYSSLSLFSGPATLSLTRSLHTVISHYQNKTNKTCVDRDRPLGQVVLVLAPTSRITDNDYETSLASVHTIKDTFPEISILYLSGGGNFDSFQRLSRNYRNDYAENATVIDVGPIVNQISAKLGNMAGHLVNFYCNESRTHFEDYVTPDLSALYEIDGTYLQRADVILRVIADWSYNFTS